VSEWGLPAGILLAAVGLTYFFCVRPMRRRNCATSAAERLSTTEELDRALDGARTELARLCADAERSPQAHHDAPAPPTLDRLLKEEHR
jgi:hypothetical protein